MTFGLTDGAPGSLAILHVEQEVLRSVISVLLVNVAKILGLYEPNVLSTVFLLTVIFGMAGSRAFGTPNILILEG